MKIQKIFTKEEAMSLLTDNRKFEIFLAQNKGYFESIICGFTNNRKYKYCDIYDFDDLLQVAYLSLMKAIENYKNDMGASLGTYARTVITNDIHQEILRDNKKIDNEMSFEALNVQSDSDGEGETYEMAILDNTNVNIQTEFENDIINKIVLNKTLDGLSPLHRKICELKISGHTFEEIAEKLEIKLSYLKTVYFRYFFHEFKECRDII